MSPEEPLRSRSVLAGAARGCGSRNRSHLLLQRDALGALVSYGTALHLLAHLVLRRGLWGRREARMHEAICNNYAHAFGAVGPVKEPFK